MSIDTECSLWLIPTATVELAQACTRRSNRPNHRELRTVISEQHQRCGVVERIHRLHWRCPPQSAGCRATGLRRYQGVLPMRVEHHRSLRVLPFPVLCQGHRLFDAENERRKRARDITRPMSFWKTNLDTDVLRHTITVVVESRTVQQFLLERQ